MPQSSPKNSSNHRQINAQIIAEGAKIIAKQLLKSSPNNSPNHRQRNLQIIAEGRSHWPAKAAQLSNYLLQVLCMLAEPTDGRRNTSYRYPTAVRLAAYIYHARSPNPPTAVRIPPTSTSAAVDGRPAYLQLVLGGKSTLLCTGIP